MPELIKIISDTPYDVRETVSNLWTNSMFVVNIGVNREKIKAKNLMHFQLNYLFIKYFEKNAHRYGCHEYIY